MKLMGASADQAVALTDRLMCNAHLGLASLVFCDGDDVVGAFADPGETADDVQRAVREHFPQVLA